MENDNSTAEGSYDFGARIYDSRIGRWLSVDRLSKKYPMETPYLFVSGNPNIYKDPDGNDKIITIYLKIGKTMVPILEMVDPNYFVAEAQSKSEGLYDLVKYNVHESQIYDLDNGGKKTTTSRVDYSNPIYDISAGEYLAHKTWLGSVVASIYKDQKKQSKGAGTFQKAGYSMSGGSGTTLDLKNKAGEILGHLELSTLLSVAGVLGSDLLPLMKTLDEKGLKMVKQGLEILKGAAEFNSNYEALLTGVDGILSEMTGQEKKNEKPDDVIVNVEIPRKNSMDSNCDIRCTSNSEAKPDTIKRIRYVDKPKKRI